MTSSKTGKNILIKNKTITCLVRQAGLSISHASGVAGLSSFSIIISRIIRDNHYNLKLCTDVNFNFPMDYHKDNVV